MDAPVLQSWWTSLPPRSQADREGHRCSRSLSLHSCSETLFTFFGLPCVLALFSASGKSQLKAQQAQSLDWSLPVRTIIRACGAAQGW